MKVEHFMGKAECTDFDEIEKILKARTQNGVNEFVIAGKEYYPFIMMAVKDDHATISYFEKEDDLIYTSIGGNTDLGEDGISVFYTNTEMEEITVENCSVLPFSKAVMVIKEFFETMKLPKCIEWEEL